MIGILNISRWNSLGLFRLFSRIEERVSDYHLLNKPVRHADGAENAMKKQWGVWTTYETSTMAFTYCEAGWCTPRGPHSWWTWCSANRSRVYMYVLCVIILTLTVIIGFTSLCRALTRCCDAGLAKLNSAFWSFAILLLFTHCLVVEHRCYTKCWQFLASFIKSTPTKQSITCSAHAEACHNMLTM